MAAADSAATRRRVLADLGEDFIAQSYGGSLNSMFRTWCEFHAHWFGHDSPVLPLTPEKISCLAAMFKAGGYRSFRNYLAKAKDEHLASGFDWGSFLHRAARGATRSVLRALGPPKQSEPLDVPAIVRLKLGADPLVPGGPLDDGRLIECGAMFLTREIECARAEIGHVRTRKDARVAEWLMPVSKSDTAALGTKLAWGCTCDAPVPKRRSKPCACHALLEHLDVLRRILGGAFCEDGVSPLFPNGLG